MSEKNKQPDITFTEAEVQGVAEFVNFVFKEARFDIVCGDARKLTAHLNHMHHIVKKMESHIMEIKRTFKAPKTAVKRKAKAKAKT